MKKKKLKLKKQNKNPSSLHAKNPRKLYVPSNLVPSFIYTFNINLCITHWR